MEENLETVYGPIQLKNINVIDKAPLFGNLLNNPLTFEEYVGLNRIEEKPEESTFDKLFIHPWNRFRDDFVKYDPIFGARRRSLVSKYYDKNNPFREGADIVGNVSSDILLSMLGLKGMGSLLTAMRTAGAAYVPSLMGTLAGGYAGQKLLDNVLIDTTGKPMTQHLKDAGFDTYGQVMFSPGAWLGSAAGSWAGTKATQALVNIEPWFYNSTPKLAITPEGPVEIMPGEVVSGQGSYPTGYQNSSQGVSGWRGNYTTKTGSGGNASGQSGRVQTHQGNGTTRIPGGVQSRVMSNVNNSSSGQTAKTGYTVSRPPMAYEEIPWVPNFIPFPNTTFTHLVAPPVVTPVIPPVAPPPADIRFEEKTEYDDPWIRWYASQPEGTVQTWEGDPESSKPAGKYKIHRVKGENFVIDRRRVANDEGFVAPDSTSYNIRKVNNYNYNTHAPIINELEGAVDPRAIIDYNQNIFYKKGGRLIPKKRFKQ